MASILAIRGRISCILLLLLQLAHTVLSSSAPRHLPVSYGAELSEREIPNLQIQNVSAQLPSRDFSIDIADGGWKYLNSRGCFELTVLAMEQLSKEPWYGSLNHPVTLQTDISPGYRIKMSGDRSAFGFGIRYMIWGLVRAIKYMNDRNDFRNYQFRLRWKNAVVGLVSLDSQVPSSALEGADVSVGNSSATMNSSENVGGANLTRDSSDDDDDPILTPEITWATPIIPLRFNDVMMVIIGGYAEVAVHNMEGSQAQTTLRTVFPPYQAEIVLHLVRYWGSVGWFKFKYIHVVLSELSRWYLEHRECNAVDMRLMIGERVFGLGAVQKPRSSVISAGAGEGTSIS